jgi:diguanylate cyclase (GGDEF)-like protein
VLTLVHEDDFEDAAAQLASAVDGTRESTPFVVRVRDASGRWCDLECVATNLLDEPAVRGILITARDATERERLARDLAHRAQHDPLTDLPNRQLLEERLLRALARADRSASRIAVCFVDLDGFKAVNDTLGHAAGDALLRDVAGALGSELRTGDTAARIGGDEFVLILDPAEEADEVLAALRRIRTAMLAHQPSSGDVRIGASFGVTLSEPFDSVVSMLKRADDALYRAKAAHDSIIEIG